MGLKEDVLDFIAGEAEKIEVNKPSDDSGAHTRQYVLAYCRFSEAKQLLVMASCEPDEETLKTTRARLDALLADSDFAGNHSYMVETFDNDPEKYAKL